MAFHPFIGVRPGRRARRLALRVQSRSGDGAGQVVAMGWLHAIVQLVSVRGWYINRQPPGSHAHFTTSALVASGAGFGVRAQAELPSFAQAQLAWDPEKVRLM